LKYRVFVAMQAVQLQELESMRAELTVAYDSNADLRDRIHSLQQQVAAMRAEAAARTPVGVTIEKVMQRLVGLFACCFNQLVLHTFASSNCMTSRLIHHGPGCWTQQTQADYCHCVPAQPSFRRLCRVCRRNQSQPINVHPLPRQPQRTRARLQTALLRLLLKLSTMQGI
jgi:hypothetical protein